MGDITMRKDALEELKCLCSQNNMHFSLNSCLHSIGKILGRGKFAVIHELIIHDDKLFGPNMIALKLAQFNGNEILPSINNDNNGNVDNNVIITETLIPPIRIINEFHREVDAMINLNHTNIVSMIGFNFKPFALICELMHFGNLSDMLNNLDLEV
jgi:hypothetical protein